MAMRNGYESPDELGEDIQQLEHERKLNDLRLKSRFEQIFEKYEHDFDGIGDEIDIDTGEVVVDNGHLQYMQDEADPGNSASSEFVRSFQQNLEQEGEDNDGDEQEAFSSTGESVVHEYDELFDGGEEDADRAARHTGIKQEFRQPLACDASDPFKNMSRPAPRLAQLFVGEGTPQLPFDLTADESSASSESGSDFTATTTGADYTSGLQDSIKSLNSIYSRRTVDDDTIQALGVSIANQVMGLMRTASKQKPEQTSKKNKAIDPAWDCPEPGEEVFFRRRLAESRTVTPSLASRSTCSPGRRSIWAPANSRKRRRLLDDDLPATSDREDHMRANDTPVRQPETAFSTFKNRINGPPRSLTKTHSSYVAKRDAQRQQSRLNVEASFSDDEPMDSHETGAQPVPRAHNISDATTQPIELRRERIPSEGLLDHSTLVEPAVGPQSADLPCADTGQVHFTAANDADIVYWREKKHLSFDLIAERLPGTSAADVALRYRQKLQNAERPIIVPEAHFTAAEDEEIIRLKERGHYAFETIAKQLPGRSERDVRLHYRRNLRKRKDQQPELQLGGDQERPSPNGLAELVQEQKTTSPIKSTTTVFQDNDGVWNNERDKLLLGLREDRNLGWSDIAAHIPTFGIGDIRRRYTFLTQGPSDINATKDDSQPADDPTLLGIPLEVKPPIIHWDQPAPAACVPSQQPLLKAQLLDAGVPMSQVDSKCRGYTDKEKALLVKLRGQKLTWDQISTHFHNRTAGSLQSFWSSKQMLLKRSRLSASVQPESNQNGPSPLPNVSNGYVPNPFEPQPPLPPPPVEPQPSLPPLPEGSLMTSTRTLPLQGGGDPLLSNKFISTRPPQSPAVTVDTQPTPEPLRTQAAAEHTRHNDGDVIPNNSSDSAGPYARLIPGAHELPRAELPQTAVPSMRFTISDDPDSQTGMKDISYMAHHEQVLQSIYLVFRAHPLQELSVNEIAALVERAQPELSKSFGATEKDRKRWRESIRRPLEAGNGFVKIPHKTRHVRWKYTGEQATSKNEGPSVEADPSPSLVSYEAAPPKLAQSAWDSLTTSAPRELDRPWESAVVEGRAPHLEQSQSDSFDVNRSADVPSLPRRRTTETKTPSTRTKTPLSARHGQARRKEVAVPGQVTMSSRPGQDSFDNENAIWEIPDSEDDHDDDFYTASTSKASIAGSRLVDAPRSPSSMLDPENLHKTAPMYSSTLLQNFADATDQDMDCDSANPSCRSAQATFVDSSMRPSSTLYPANRLSSSLSSVSSVANALSSSPFPAAQSSTPATVYSGKVARHASANRLAQQYSGTPATPATPTSSNSESPRCMESAAHVHLKYVDTPTGKASGPTAILDYRSSRARNLQTSRDQTTWSKRSSLQTPALSVFALPSAGRGQLPSRLNPVNTNSSTPVKRVVETPAPAEGGDEHADELA